MLPFHVACGLRNRFHVPPDGARCNAAAFELPKRRQGIADCELRSREVSVVRVETICGFQRKGAGVQTHKPVESGEIRKVPSLSPADLN